MFTSAVIIEDHPDVALLLRETLALAQVDSSHATSLEEGRRMVADVDPDLILVDLILPDGNGMDLVSEFRASNPDRPIVILTGVDSPETLVQGLDEGADLYLRKPFTATELLAQLRALYRRTARASAVIAVDGVKVDRVERTVEHDGRETRLTTVELRLLDTILAAQGEVVDRETLFRRVWKLDFDPGTGLLHSHIRNLRQKLAPLGLDQTIVSVRGRGYRFDEEQIPAATG
jgi:DNA-binding response OmpR family regulator